MKSVMNFQINVYFNRKYFGKNMLNMWAAHSRIRYLGDPNF